MFKLGSATEIAPDTSPSVIKFIFTFNDSKVLIIKLCLGRLRTHAVNLLGLVFFASDNNAIFFF